MLLCVLTLGILCVILGLSVCVFVCVCVVGGGCSYNVWVSFKVRVSCIQVKDAAHEKRTA